MSNPYVVLLRTPGGLAFSSAGFVARLPISMLGIGTVLLVEGTTGSYGLAGAVTAALALSAAVGSPQVARLVDRWGQRAVGLPATAVHVAALVGLVVCAEEELPTWTLFATAIVAGATQPPIGSFVRARWAVRWTGTPTLRTAYSFEAVVDEIIFVVGPPLVTLLALRTGAGWALLSTAVFVGVGTLLLLAQRRTEPTVAPHEHLGGRSAVAEGGMPVVVLTATALGGVFGAVEIVTVAFAEEQGSGAVAGLVLALYALGSLVAGLAYGVIHPTAPLRRQYQVGCAAMVVAALALPFARSVPVLAVTAFVAGFAISPTLIAGISLVEELVPAARLTEGLTWETTGIAAGVAAGASAAGPVVDAAGASDAYWVAFVFAVASFLTVSLGQRTLLRAAEAATHRPA